MGAPYDTNLFADFCDAVDSLYDDVPGWTTNALGYLWEEDIEEMTMDEDGYGDDGNLHVVSKFDELGDAYDVGHYLVDLAMKNGKRPDNVAFLMNKFLKFAEDEQGYYIPRF